MDETRFNQYKELFEKGLTYEEVGEAMGVTRQRAHAIYKRYFQNTLKKVISCRLKKHVNYQ